MRTAETALETTLEQIHGDDGLISELVDTQAERDELLSTVRSVPGYTGTKVFRDAVAELVESEHAAISERDALAAKVAAVEALAGEGYAFWRMYGPTCEHCGTQSSASIVTIAAVLRGER